MIQSRRRRRYGMYSVSSGSGMEGWGRSIAILLAITFVIICVWVFLRLFAGADERRSVATTLQTNDRGRVEVTINKSDPQRAESGLRLYDGDKIQTDSAGYATLLFFDDTIVILDHNSIIELGDVLQGEESSLLSIELIRGRIYIKTSEETSVERLIASSFAKYVIPPKTQMVLGGDTDTGEKAELLAVVTTTGPGVISTFLFDGLVRDHVITGEGQELYLSTSSIAMLKEKSGDPYDLRTSLDHILYEDSFYLFGFESGMHSENSELSDSSVEEAISQASEDQEITIDGEILVLDSPDDGVLLTENVVLVEGRVAPRVITVRVNGYVAELTEGVFQKEIALPEEEKFDVEVQVEDRDGIVIATKTLTLYRDIQPPASPTIASPASVTVENMDEIGSVAVQEESFELIGEASEDAIGIIVNGYRLQKYKSGKPWSYLVDSKIGNVHVGENTYEVIAVDRSGNTSEPVRIVILWRAEPVPTIINGEKISRDTGTYLFPDSLRVIAPTSDGSSYVTSEDEVFIEGETHSDTHTISVNGFSLTLYEPGKVTWNYIAKSEFGNYKSGVNRYVVAARNAEGKILDVVRYTVEKR